MFRLKSANIQWHEGSRYWPCQFFVSNDFICLSIANTVWEFRPWRSHPSQDCLFTFWPEHEIWALLFDNQHDSELWGIRFALVTQVLDLQCYFEYGKAANFMFENIHVRVGHSNATVYSKHNRQDILTEGDKNNKRHWDRIPGMNRGVDNLLVNNDLGLSDDTRMAKKKRTLGRRILTSLSTRL